MRSKRRTFLWSALGRQAAAPPRPRPLQVSMSSRSSGARLPARRCNARNSCRRLIEQDVPGVRAVTEQKVTRMLTFVAARQPEVTEHFHGLMIDRGAFDRMLAHEAALERRRLPLRRDGVVDRRRRHGNDVRRRPLAAACPDRRRRAALARRCGDRAVNRDLVDTRQVTVPLVLPHEATDIFLSADYRGGYAWLFPKGAVANVGLGVCHRVAKIAQAAARCALHKACRTSVALGRGHLPSRAAPFRSAAACDRSARLERTAVLLAGDAAGLTNPVTGAGIASAVQSGALAGRAAADFLAGAPCALDEYEEELGDIFDAALERALRRRRDVLARYADGGRPDARALSDGWIASPHYWAA